MNNKKIRLLLVLLLLIFFALGIFIGYYIKSNNEDVELSDGTQKAVLIPTISYTRSNKSSSVVKDTIISFVGRFKYYGKKDYYYKWQIMADRKVIGETSCKKIDFTKSSLAKIKITKDNQYGRWVIYKDSSCSKKLISYKTDSYSLVKEVINNIASNNTDNSNYNSNNSNATTKKTFTASFVSNGATSIGSQKLTCTTIGRKCSITAPSIIRSGYIIKGWGKRSNSSFALYDVGDSITLYGDRTFYALTSKASVSSNNSTSGTIKMGKYASPMTTGLSGELSSTVYPSNSVVTYKSSNPNVIRVEKNSSGKYIMYTVSPGVAIITATSSTGATDSITYVVINNKEENVTKYVKKGVSSTNKINGFNVYSENGCATDIVNKYIDDINAVPIKHSYPRAVYIVTEESLNSTWNNINALGLTYGSGADYYVFVNCKTYFNQTVAHEFGHVLDYYYNFTTGNPLLNSDPEMIRLYGKYNKNTALKSNPYAFDSLAEFFATNYSFYYLKHYAKVKYTSSELNTYKYPSDLENAMINILKRVENDL